MAFQPAVGVAQFNVRATLQGEPVENVFHYWDVVNPIWSAAQLTTWAEQLGTEWVANIMPLLSVSYTLLEVEARDLSAEGGLTGSWSPAEPTAGSVTGEAIPNNVAFCLTKVTGRAGRSYRGRTYICGFSETQIANNRVPPVLADNLRDALASILIRPSSSTIGGVVLSRQNQGAERPAAQPTVITAIRYFDLVLDSQRRRLPGRG